MNTDMLNDINYELGYLKGHASARGCEWRANHDDGLMDDDFIDLVGCTDVFREYANTATITTLDDVAELRNKIIQLRSSLRCHPYSCIVLPAFAIVNDDGTSTYPLDVVVSAVVAGMTGDILMDSYERNETLLAELPFEGMCEDDDIVLLGRPGAKIDLSSILGRYTWLSDEVGQDIALLPGANSVFFGLDG